LTLWHFAGDGEPWCTKPYWS